jgi:hypothetical protein
MTPDLCLHDESSTSPLPFVCSWDSTANPLPMRTFRSTAGSRKRRLGLEAPPWLGTGRLDQPFDFCGFMRRLCADVVNRCEILRHIDVARLLFGGTQARTQRAHGLQARVTPLRFEHGQLIRRRHGCSYQVQRYFVCDQEMLYVVAFCLPRFLDQDFDDKLVTVFHELYHISPAFDGDLRRHDGRYAIHSHSKRGYDAHMADLARSYLAGGANPELHAFLRLNFSQLQHRHGKVVGTVVPRPKLIPVPTGRMGTAARD